MSEQLETQAAPRVQLTLRFDTPRRLVLFQDGRADMRAWTSMSDWVTAMGATTLRDVVKLAERVDDKHWHIHLRDDVTKHAVTVIAQEVLTGIRLVASWGYAEKVKLDKTLSTCDFRTEGYKVEVDLAKVDHPLKRSNGAMTTEEREAIERSIKPMEPGQDADRGEKLMGPGPRVPRRAPIDLPGDAERVERRITQQPKQLSIQDVFDSLDELLEAGAMEHETAWKALAKVLKKTR